jgi:20S proteasome alpha/beta subunit
MGFSADPSGAFGSADGTRTGILSDAELELLDEGLSDETTTDEGFDALAELLAACVDDWF